MIKALIVDDEQTAIDLLKWVLGQYCPEVSVIRTATSASRALEVLKDFQPDLLFLDIRMPGQNGFDLLLELPAWDFDIIFVTAHNEFAIRAIKFSALDYLLKPVDGEELVLALDRFKRKRTGRSYSQPRLRNFIHNLEASHKSQFRLAVPTVSEVHYFPVNEIIRLEADRNYTRFFLAGKKTFVSAKTLREYEEMLTEYGFIRVHKSHLVNRQFVVRFERQGNLVLTDQTSVEVSRRRREYVSEALRGLT